MANRLRRHPAKVRRLSAHRLAIDQVARGRIPFLPAPVPVLVSATAVSPQTGLPINDALIVAVMQANGLSNIASADTDFDRVPGLTRYAPA
ncbi:MAG TPA: type II toxin-antitoxin system VapC family toxin [Gemmataceae bacterium]|nr:type II toxin-antitoxin system VapC family toxin [Gemmataceae bacterium]